MEVSMINLLDTLTNLVFLMVAILPAYIIGLSLVIGDVVIPAMPTLHPMVKVKINGHLKIITLRNPITKKWIVSFTLPMPAQHVTLTPSKPIAAFGNPYRYAMGCLAIAFLVACENPVQDNGRKAVQIFADHPTACLEMFPVTPDTIVRHLEKWTLKVNTDPTKLRTSRNRCVWVADQEWAECDSKSRAPSEPALADTVYGVDRICPATLKARAELGG